MSLLANDRPQGVDLDGALLRPDLLLVSAFCFLRRHPKRALVFWRAL
jgi:hypothetical protein